MYCLVVEVGPPRIISLASENHHRPLARDWRTLHLVKPHRCCARAVPPFASIQTVGHPAWLRAALVRVMPPAPMPCCWGPGRVRCAFSGVAQGALFHSASHDFALPAVCVLCAPGSPQRVLCVRGFPVRSLDCGGPDAMCSARAGVLKLCAKQPGHLPSTLVLGVRGWPLRVPGARLRVLCARGCSVRALGCGGPGGLRGVAEAVCQASWPDGSVPSPLLFFRRHTCRIRLVLRRSAIAQGRRDGGLGGVRTVRVGVAAASSVKAASSDVELCSSGCAGCLCVAEVQPAVRAGGLRP